MSNAALRECSLSPWLPHGVGVDSRLQPTREPLLVLAAQQSIVVQRMSNALAVEVRLLRRRIRELEHLLAELDQEGNRQSTGLERSRRTIPSIGQATAPASWAEIVDIRPTDCGAVTN